MVATSLKSGATVDNRYRVERLLGRGELGCTYLCRDLTEQESLVALRPLTEWSGAGGLTGLRQELSFLSRFKHPHLVHLMNFGVMERGQTPYVVRQFAAGVDIFQGSTQWNIEQVLDQLSKICRVLHFLHSRGVIHRHLKPSNIILAGGEGSEQAPKLLDFGLERCAPRGRGNPVTLAYTAPEILLDTPRIRDLICIHLAFLPTSCLRAVCRLMMMMKVISFRNICKGRRTCAQSNG